jgi:hypothetical protein
MAASQAQYLLMLAEDARQHGDQLAEEMRQKGAAHAQQVAELSTLIDRAKEIIDREKSRFGQYLPQQQSPPNAVERITARRPQPSGNQ